MGQRGPQPDPLQAAKGFPGRRKAKAKAAIAAAAELAVLLAPRQPVNEPVPDMLADPLFAGAAQLWLRWAPDLRRTGRLPAGSEIYLMQLCVYVQEWMTATLDLHGNGFSQRVKTTVGGTMERRRPPVFDRQTAFNNALDLAARFGLTPVDMYALFKDQAAAIANNPQLPGLDRPAQAQEPEAPASRIGGMAAMRSEPPAGAKPN